jgi:hypothetical protein
MDIRDLHLENLTLGELIELGKTTDLTRDEAQSYLPDVNEGNFYTPRVGPDFYVPSAMRGLTRPRLPQDLYGAEGMRGLTDPRNLRRMK